jgi:hypothetical protein
MNVIPRELLGIPPPPAIESRPQRMANPPDLGRRQIVEIVAEQLENVIDRAARHMQPTVCIKLAERQLGVQEKLSPGARIHQLDRERRPRAVTRFEARPIGKLKGQ